MSSNRRKKQRECPNPLFLKWLEEWRDEAKQKNSKLQYTYGKVREKAKYPVAIIGKNLNDFYFKKLL